MDAVDELIAYKKQSGKLSPMLRRVYRFHKRNPQVLDFLVSEMRAERASGWAKTSLGSLWHYSRWVLTRIDKGPGETFAMSNNLFPWYGRIIAILHPDLRGFFAMYKSAADEDLGPVMESGWQPTKPHEPKPVARRPRVRRAA